MADHGAPMDMPAHQATYSGFLTVFKYGAIAAFAIGAIVVLIIAR
ncbi:aa3-type cytochrome c oxidase subunit IV [Sphingomonas sp. MMS24-J13]